MPVVVLGIRPEIIKLAPVIRELEAPLQSIKDAPPDIEAVRNRFSPRTDAKQVIAIYDGVM